MLVIGAILLLLASVECIEISESSIQQNERNVGGTTVTDMKQFSYMAAIVRIKDSYFVSAAAIVGTKHITTSAESVSNIDTTNFVVLTGCADLENKKCKTYKMEKVVAHELYNPLTGANNIAIIRLQSCVEFSLIIKPIKLSFENNLVNTTCVFASWGAQSFSPQIYSNSLSAINLTIMDTGTCNALLSPTMAIDATQICANTSSSSTPCFKDIGGPLVCNGLLVGLLGFTNCQGLPAIFTIVSSHTPWLSTNAY